MRFYSLSYKDALDLPLKTFWLLSNNIGRISAEEDIRRLSITAAAASDKGFKSSQEALQREMGKVFRRPEIEEAIEGINALKEIARKMG